VCFGDDQDIHVSESWESREQLEAFGQCNRRPNYSPLGSPSPTEATDVDVILEDTTEGDRARDGHGRHGRRW